MDFNHAEAEFPDAASQQNIRIASEHHKSGLVTDLRRKTSTPCNGSAAVILSSPMTAPIAARIAGWERGVAFHRGPVPADLSMPNRRDMAVASLLTESDVICARRRKRGDVRRKITGKKSGFNGK